MSATLNKGLPWAVTSPRSAYFVSTVPEMGLRYGISPVGLLSAVSVSLRHPLLPSRPWLPRFKVDNWASNCFFSTASCDSTSSTCFVYRHSAPTDSGCAFFPVRPLRSVPEWPPPAWPRPPYGYRWNVLGLPVGTSSGKAVWNPHIHLLPCSNKSPSSRFNAMILPLASDDTMTSVDSKIPVASKSVSVPLHAASNPHKATPQMSRAPRLNPYPVFPTRLDCPARPAITYSKCPYSFCF